MRLQFFLCALISLYPAVSLAQAPKEQPVRGELQARLGISGGLTNWSGDPSGYGSLMLGMRLFGIAGPFFQGRLGYSNVDQRVLTFLSFGVDANFPVSEKVFPRAFVGFVHQHEESMAAVDNEPVGALLGIGSGIRHRAGVQAGLGLDIKIVGAPKYHILIGPELMGAYLGYSSGPHWYGQAGIVGTGYIPVF